MEKNKLDAAERAELEAVQAAQAEIGTEDGENAEPEGLILRFAKPYKFGGQEYTEVDLSGLEDVTAGVLESVGKITAKKNPGMNPALQEMSLTFCTYLAQRVAKLPLEFFTGLPAKEAIKLKAMVTNFLYGGDGED
jgi:hypothetical protein